jgi:hypothetical protein
VFEKQQSKLRLEERPGFAGSALVAPAQSPRSSKKPKPNNHRIAALKGFYHLLLEYFCCVATW